MTTPEALRNWQKAKSTVENIETHWQVLCARNPSVAIELLFRVLVAKGVIGLFDLDDFVRKLGEAKTKTED